MAFRRRKGAHTLVSHFSCIGFTMDTGNAISDAVVTGIEKGDVLGKRGCPYYLKMWSPVVGAEIWTQHLAVPEEKKIYLIGCDPHYSGSGKTRVAITGVMASESNPCDGAVAGWADPSELDNVESGCYPFSFHVPDFLIVQDSLQVGAITTFQIAAFAETLKCFLDEEQYEELAAPVAWHFDGEPVFVGSGSFFPASRTSNGTTTCEHNPRAFFTGSVRLVETVHNSECGGHFYHMLVQTYGGCYDVVACPEAVDGVPVVGGVVQGNFWLSGRIAQQ